MPQRDIRRVIRWALLAVALLAIWLGVLAWAAGVPWTSPLFAHVHLSISARDLHMQSGIGVADADGLAVSALGADGTGLQSTRLSQVRAENLPVLRYRMRDFPRIVELVLVFRRADTPNDVQTISLPAPGRGEVAVNLATLSEWRGEIVELGFAEYAAAQLVPPSQAVFAPFHIESVELESPSWSQIFSRLRSDWFGYQAWSLRSINTLGAPTETLPASSMQVAIGIGAALSLLAFWLILRGPRRRMTQAALVASIAAWLLLDLRWLDDFAAKHEVIEKLYAGKDWNARAILQPDEDTLAAAQEVTRLAAEQHVNRVLVLSDSTFTALRFVYFLLPLNAVSMETVLATAPSALPPDVLIADFDSGWNYDAASGNLSKNGAAYPVVALYERGALHVYRSRGAAR